MLVPEEDTVDANTVDIDAFLVMLMTCLCVAAKEKMNTLIEIDIRLLQKHEHDHTATFLSPEIKDDDVYKWTSRLLSGDRLAWDDFRLKVEALESKGKKDFLDRMAKVEETVRANLTPAAT